MTGKREFMGKRLGFIGIIITDRLRQAGRVNAILSEFGEIIHGRMGLPYKEKDCSVITLTVVSPKIKYVFT